MDIKIIRDENGTEHAAGTLQISFVLPLAGIAPTLLDEMLKGALVEMLQDLAGNLLEMRFVREGAVIRLYEACGSCGNEHPADFTGDCRDNANRREGLL